jgi:hypothetical protein
MPRICGKSCVGGAPRCEVAGTPTAEPLGIVSAVDLGAAVPLLVAVVVGATWYAGFRLRTLRLSGND